ncbi:MAG: hypothetical protein CMO80_01495 [Verrucomicrobiales bacterium]|nr:hypothetical protein [Verrucomicrobiales bacterium]|tara:strand:- start:314 stop:853 length:540 start_codon:yes stop_codon:yes gene_type:complete
MSDLISAVSDLLDVPGLAPLGPGPRSSVTSEAALNEQLDDIFAQHGKPPKAELISSLVMLWHDHLDASHSISQSEYNPDGSLVHAIMHRREPDYSNAKYWWRSTGDHVCFPDLAEAVAPLVEGESELADQILGGGYWDAFGFTDAVSRGIREPEDSERHQLLKQIQRSETDVVLAHLAS